MQRAFAQYTNALNPVLVKALAAIDLAMTVVPGADAAKLVEVGAKGAAKAGGEQAAFALVRWVAGKTDGKVAAKLDDNVLRAAFRANGGNISRTVHRRPTMISRPISWQLARSTSVLGAAMGIRSSTRSTRMASTKSAATSWPTFATTGHLSRTAAC